jgi:hypothetical protein
MFVDQTLQPNDSEPIREILPEDLDRISGGRRKDPSVNYQAKLEFYLNYYGGVSGYTIGL